MNYAYLRISTVAQDEQNQRQGVDLKAKQLNLQIDKYIIDKVSGSTSPKVRNLGKLIKWLKTGDVVIVSELSRLSRSLFDLFNIFQAILAKGIKLITVKENFVVDDSIQSKAMIFAFGLSAEIEKNLIRERTKEALERKKALGVRLGRPQGAKTKIHKLERYKQNIALWLKKGVSRHKIAKRCKVCDKTLRRYIKANNLG